MGTLLVSRKFWVALVALAVIVVGAFVPDYALDEQALVGLTPDQLTGFAVVIGGYIAGVAIEGKYQKELGQFFTTNIVEQTDPASGNK
jgi:hypothetical protein